MPTSPQLYLFDCDRQVDIAVPNQDGSSIVIGRDSILQCNDARISRNHGTLKLDADKDGGAGGLQITSTHSNPIFIRTGADGVLNILAKDLTATLQKGDKFALLPDQYWYEVRFREVSPVPEEVTSTGPSLRVRTMEEVNSGPIPEEVASGEKRKNAEESEADCSKKIRTEETSDQPPVEPAPETTNSEEVTSEPTTVIKPDPDAAEGTSSGSKSPQQQQDSTANPSVAAVKQEAPDSSTGPPLRPSCQFGISCYRHTPDHRAQFAHPHDADYRRPTFPPAPSDAPHCPFGASCYRRNPQHFRDLQHPDSTFVTPPVNRVVQVQVPVINVANANGAPPTQRRRNQFARDVLMAAIINGVGADDDTESDGDDDGRSLFGSGSESDEYNPDLEEEEDDDYGGRSEEEEEEEQQDEE